MRDQYLEKNYFDFINAVIVYSNYIPEIYEEIYKIAIQNYHYLSFTFLLCSLIQTNGLNNLSFIDFDPKSILNPFQLKMNIQIDSNLTQINSIILFS